MAGIKPKRYCSDLVNLASALSVPLKQTPDAPTLADLGVALASGYFAFIGPKACQPKHVMAAVAIGDVISTEGTKVNGLLNKAFGNACAGDDLQALVEGILQLQASCSSRLNSITALLCRANIRSMSKVFPVLKAWPFGPALFCFALGVALVWVPLDRSGMIVKVRRQ